jgi:copper chaperone CopZ
MTDTKLFHVEGMDCTGCESNIRFALSTLAGVERVEADHRAKTVEGEFDPERMDEAEVRGAIEGIGYTVGV